MEYPSFMEVKKLAKADTQGMKSRRLAVVGDCATQHLCMALKGMAAQEKIALELYEADYKQIELQLFDAASGVYAFAPDEILIFMCTEVLYQSFCDTPAQQRADFARMQYEKINLFWSAVSQNSHAVVLQTLFMERDDRVFGNFGSKTEQAFIFQLRKLNYLLMTNAAENRNVNLVDLQYVCNRFQQDQLHDAKMYCMAKLPYALNALPLIAGQVIGIISARMGRVKKCLILDLDNTLWGGVVGDDGSDGIQIGELGTGQAFTAFQHWLKRLKERGVLLAVCSKNEEAAAKEPFINNPDMVLRLEDISLFVANWQNKAQNIMEMQKILNIGMDSIVFVDDNPFERESVRQLVADITVPEMPKDPALYVEYLESLNLFETVSFSEEDSLRTDQYRSEIGRAQSQSLFSSFDDYLISLDMTAQVKEFDSYHIPRISQLSQRSNQFNLRTVRYSEEDVARIAESENYITLYFTLTDSFGDYGLISAVIMEKKNEDTLFIDTWFMSCRVLKRGMEEFIINSAVNAAAQAGYSRILGEYIPTAKNAMVRNIYPDMGFAATEQENVYVLNVREFEPKSTYIKEVI